MGNKLHPIGTECRHSRAEVPGSADNPTFSDTYEYADGHEHPDPGEHTDGDANKHGNPEWDAEADVHTNGD
jgi:hypothetical protein